MTALGLQPFLAYQAVIKLWHGGEQRSFDSLRKAEDFISSLSQRRTFAVAPQGGGGGGRGGGGGGRPWPSGRGLMAGMKAMLAAWKKMVAGGIWMLARSLFFFLLSSPPGILFKFIRYNCLFAGKTNPPLFFLEGTNGE